MPGDLFQMPGNTGATSPANLGGEGAEMCTLWKRPEKQGAGHMARLLKNSAMAGP